MSFIIASYIITRIPNNDLFASITINIILSLYLNFLIAFHHETALSNQIVERNFFFVNKSVMLEVNESNVPTHTN